MQGVLFVIIPLSPISNHFVNKFNLLSLVFSSSDRVLMVFCLLYDFFSSQSPLYIVIGVLSCPKKFYDGIKQIYRSIEVSAYFEKGNENYDFS